MAQLPLSVFIIQRPTQRNWTRRQQICRTLRRIGSAALVYIALLALAAYVLLRAWQGMQWQAFWLTLFYTLIGVIILFGAILTNSGIVQHHRRVGDLLWDDPTVMADCPIVDPQPEKVPVPDLPIESVPVAQISTRQVLVADGTSLKVGALQINAHARIFFANFVVIFLPFFALTSVDENAFGFVVRFGDGWFTFAGVLDFALMLTCLFFVVTPVWLIKRGGIVPVTADHEGLHWDAGHHVPWGEIKRFVRQENPRAKAGMPAGVAYYVDSETVAISWIVGHEASSRTKRASLFLQQLIVSHTDIPLRDVTAFSDEMHAARNDVRRLATRRRAKGQDVASLEDIADQIYPSQARWLQQAWSLAVIGALLVPVVALGILGAHAQSVQDGYFAALPGRLMRETPLYHSNMRQPDGMWPMAAPTPSQAFGAEYTASGYQLHGDLAGAYQTALMPRTFTDAAVAVTVTFTAPATPTQNDFDAGVVVRADASGRHALVFTVSSDGGFWSGQLCNLRKHDYPSGCQSLFADINQLNYGSPQEAALHLFLVMHGDSFLLYINGQLYGTYNDAARLVPATGRIGFYSGDSSQPVTFSDVTIVPVRGQVPWEYT